MSCSCLFIYCDIEVFIRVVSLISFKFFIFNSRCLELWLVLFASYDVLPYGSYGARNVTIDYLFTHS